MKNPEDLARFHGGPWHRSHLRSVLAPAPQSLLGATILRDRLISPKYLEPILRQRSVPRSVLNVPVSRERCSARVSSPLVRL